MPAQSTLASGLAFCTASRKSTKSRLNGDRSLVNVTDLLPDTLLLECIPGRYSKPPHVPSVQCSRSLRRVPPSYRHSRPAEPGTGRRDEEPRCMSCTRACLEKRTSSRRSWPVPCSIGVGCRIPILTTSYRSDGAMPHRASILSSLQGIADAAFPGPE